MHLMSMFGLICWQVLLWLGLFVTEEDLHCSRLCLDSLQSDISAGLVIQVNIAADDCVVFIIIIIANCVIICIIRIIAVIVRIQPFVLKGTCLSHFDIIFS